MTNKPVSTSQDYNNNGGSQYSWVGQESEEDKNTLGGNNNTYSPIDADNSSLMAMFSNTKTSPTCSSSLSGYGGMYCVTPEQTTYINQRGGNRTTCGNDV